MDAPAEVSNRSRVDADPTDDGRVEVERLDANLRLPGRVERNLRVAVLRARGVGSGAFQARLSCDCDAATRSQERAQLL